MVGGNIVGRVRPLRIAGYGHGADNQSENPTALHPVVRHETLLVPILDRSARKSKAVSATKAAKGAQAPILPQKKAARTFLLFVPGGQ
jgi:hypothetical protein